MPKLTVARLIETLRATEYREIFLRIPTPDFIFTAKAFKKDLLEKLATLTQDENAGVHIKHGDDVLYLTPSPKVLAALNFHSGKTMNGEKFAEEIRSTKGSVSVKFPLAGANIPVKIDKSTLAENVAMLAATERTNMRLYGRASGTMIVRPYAEG